MLRGNSENSSDYIHGKQSYFTEPIPDPATTQNRCWYITVSLRECGVDAIVNPRARFSIRNTQSLVERCRLQMRTIAWSARKWALSRWPALDSRRPPPPPLAPIVHYNRPPFQIVGSLGWASNTSIPGQSIAIVRSLSIQGNSRAISGQSRACQQVSKTRRLPSPVRINLSL